jgi:hypothetical protein
MEVNRNIGSLGIWWLSPLATVTWDFGGSDSIVTSLGPVGVRMRVEGCRRRADQKQQGQVVRHRLSGHWLEQGVTRVTRRLGHGVDREIS